MGCGWFECVRAIGDQVLRDFALQGPLLMQVEVNLQNATRSLIYANHGAPLSVAKVTYMEVVKPYPTNAQSLYG